MAGPNVFGDALLCRECTNGPQPTDGSLRICVEAQVLQNTGYACRSFLSRVLQLVSAARNTAGENPWEEHWRILHIHLTNHDPSKQCLKLFLDKIVDKLNSMVQGSCFSENFSLNEDKGYIHMHVRSCTAFLSTFDYMSPESCDRGLLSLSFERFRDIMFNSSRSVSSMNDSTEQTTQSSPFQGELTNGAPVEVKESTHLQLKSLVPGQKENKKVQQGPKPERFRPTSGKDFVQWMWGKFPKTLGEYISAFAKCSEGGSYFCGIREEDDEPNYDGNDQVRKVNKIRALEMSETWKRELQQALEERICNHMLWVESNDTTGYNILPPGGIREGSHFHINFLPVQGEAKPGMSLYILEVKTAPFKGIVFCRREGPEAYVFGEDRCTPIRVDVDEWLSKATEYGWCSNHRQKKDVRCGKGSHCTKCGEFEDNRGSCVTVTKLQECQKCHQ